MASSHNPLWPKRHVNLILYIIMSLIFLCMQTELYSHQSQSFRREKSILPQPPSHRSTGCNNCYTQPSSYPRARQAQIEAGGMIITDHIYHRTASIHRATNNTLPRSFHSQHQGGNDQFISKVHQHQQQVRLHFEVTSCFLHFLLVQMECMRCP